MIALNCVGFPEYGINMEGEVYNLKNGKRLKGTIHRGYYRVKLYRNGEYKRYFVHDLMAKAYMNPEYSPFVVNHINGNKLDNRLNNLEIISQSANTKHAYKQGRKAKLKGRMIYLVYQPFEKESFVIYGTKSDAIKASGNDKDATIYTLRIR